MPSTTSSSLSSDWPSSTVITPSLPTLLMASAMILPISSSELAEMVPTWAIDLSSVQGIDSFFSSSTAALTALSRPRFRSIGFMPAVTAFMPSRSMAAASTVAVVVPSPAVSEVCEATSLTICAPMFSNLFSSSISLATETPSLVTVGAPKLFSSTTLRPFGPRVTLTALARVSTPFSILVRASSEKRTSLALMIDLPRNSEWVVRRLSPDGGSGLDDRHDVVFTHHEQFVALDLDLGTGVLAEQHRVADLDVEFALAAVFEDLAVADRQDLTLDGLFGRAVGNHDATRGGPFFFDTLDDHAIMQRTQFHGLFSLPHFVDYCWIRSAGAGITRRSLVRAVFVPERAAKFHPQNRAGHVRLVRQMEPCAGHFKGRGRGFLPRTSDAGPATATGWCARSRILLLVAGAPGVGFRCDCAGGAQGGI